MSRESTAARLEREITTWPGVTAGPHRFGGREFRVGRREIGHLHGEHLADLPFPLRVRQELVAAGKAEPHHFLPDTGWVSRPIRGEADVPAVLELFRLNYARIVAVGGAGEPLAEGDRGPVV
jgi:hypothetical protein